MSCYQEMRLENGLQLSSYCMHHLHALEISVYFRGGSLYESRGNQGVSHLLEHLCFRNLNGVPQAQLYQKLDDIGAVLKGATYTEAVVFRLKVAPRFFDEAFQLFCQLFAPGTWTPEEIAAEKEVVLRQIENEDQDFWADTSRQFWKTKAGAFPIMGTKDSVRNLSSATIHQWKKKTFRPQNACVVMTGNFSQGMLQKAAEVLAEFKGPDLPAFEQPTPLQFCMRDESCDVLSNITYDQAQVHISFDLNDDLVFPLCADVLNNLTGEGVSSALFMELRERRALTDEISSTIEEVGCFRRMTITYLVAHDKLLESLEAVFSILAGLRRHISLRQMERTHVFFTDNLQFLLDETDTLNEMLGWGFLSGNSEECDLDVRAHMYEDMNEEDVLDAAQAIFRPENLCISIAKNPSHIKAQVLRETLKKCREMLL